MKFLCDRCKTRYSIGDDRVRGKILKIRCKNCANVITVREGMPEPDGAPQQAGAQRRNKTTTTAPVVAEAPAQVSNGQKPNGALGAAFASAMSKPPPALEEEWYVSIDGDQSGPFSLAEAQRWVGGKPFDAELHCWSEGFDDWLPVDKVSHFRGLRKKPAPPLPSSPPPIPRIGGTGPARALSTAAPRLPEREEEPKPLFAATMASLEKSAPVVAPTHTASLGAGAAAVGALRVEARAPAPSPVVTPARTPAHINGNGNAVRVPNLPAAKPTPTTRGVGGVGGLRVQTSPGMAAPKPLFDASELNATQAEAPAFQDEQPTTTGNLDDAPAPGPAKVPHLKSVSVDTTTAPNDAFLDALAKERKESKAEKPMLSLAAMAATTNETPTLRADDHVPALKSPTVSEPAADDGDDMDIGEVSRVVNLADLARPQKAAASSAAKRTGAVGKITGPVGRVTGPVPKINGTGTVPLIPMTDVMAGVNPLAAMDPVAEPPPEQHSRRGMIVLLVGAALLLGVAAVLVVMKLNTPEDVTGLGGQYEYNPERPDNPIAKRPGDPPGPGSVEPPQNPLIPRKPPPTRPTGPGSSRIIDPPAGNSLKSDEIEAMARSTSATTTACFRRASKGVDDIILSDVKKIRVTFHINPDGTVSAGSVDLSEKRSATLASCLQRMVAGWKFRANAGGDFGFVLAKPD